MSNKVTQNRSDFKWSLDTRGLFLYLLNYNAVSGVSYQPIYFNVIHKLNTHLCLSLSCKTVSCVITANFNTVIVCFIRAFSQLLITYIMMLLRAWIVVLIMWNVWFELFGNRQKIHSNTLNAFTLGFVVHNWRHTIFGFAAGARSKCMVHWRPRAWPRSRFEKKSLHITTTLNAKNDYEVC